MKMNINELILNFENTSKKAAKKIIENKETNISYEDISNFINKYPKFSKIIATNMHTNEIIKIMIFHNVEICDKKLDYFNTFCCKFRYFMF